MIAVTFYLSSLTLVHDTSMDADIDREYLFDETDKDEDIVGSTSNETIGEAGDDADPFIDTSLSSLTIKHTNNFNVYSSQEYLRHRTKNFNSWFEANGTGPLRKDADANGTILDFVIAGFAKCGTTSMESNLGYITPIPLESDVCTPVHQTVYYSHMNWPKKYQEAGKEKLLRGTKCPAFIQGDWLKEWSIHLPRTKVIVGIRHPVLWFQSFWNMQAANHLLGFAGNDPYKVTKPCPNTHGRGCRNGCPSNQLVCMHRGRFHNELAKLGKTRLTAEERELLGPEDPDGGSKLKNNKIRNDIFLYEQKMMKEDYMWDDLSNLLGLNETVRHDRTVTSHGKSRGLEINFCDDKYDNFRAMMMPISYNVSVWLQEFFLPLAKNESRTDVTIPRPNEFAKMVEEYKFDPCKKLTRLGNGTYAL